MILLTNVKESLGCGSEYTREQNEKVAYVRFKPPHIVTPYES